MNRRDKIGLVVLVLLLACFVAVLVWMFRGPRRPTHDYSESIFVKQRIVNLNKK